MSLFIIIYLLYMSSFLSLMLREIDIKSGVYILQIVLIIN